MQRIIQLFSRMKFDLLIILLYSMTLGYMMKYYDVQSFDIKVHNFLLMDYLKEGTFPSPPGYYGAIFLVDKLFYYKYPLVLSAILVLTFCFWWKYSLSFKWIQEQTGLSRRACFGVTFMLLFLSPIFIPAIDGSFWYLGKFTSTIWHNSTLIAVFPFCLLLVKQTLVWQETQRVGDLMKIIALGIAILLIKPSFLFCYIPALPVMSFLYFPEKRPLIWQSVGVSLLLLLLVYLEKIWIFDLDPMIPKMYTAEEQSRVVINPFRVHLHFSKEPIFDFLTSFPTTILFVILWGKRPFKSALFGFSILLVAIAIAVYFLFAETGFREFHGNFYWQIPIALFIHYLSMVIWVGRAFVANSKQANFKFYAFGLVYLTQFVFGLLYWHRLFFGNILS